MDSSAWPHLPDDELHAYSDGELSPSQRAEIAKHLLSCVTCQVAHEEVLVLRERTSQLLSLSAPIVVRRLTLPDMVEKPLVIQPRWNVNRNSLMAAGLATLLAGGWYFAAPDTRTPLPRWNSAIMAPGLFAKVKPTPGVPGEATNLMGRSMKLRPPEAIARTADSSITLATVRKPLFTLPEPIDADPAPDWERVDLKTAVEVAQGALPILEGLPLSTIKMSPSKLGARPTFLARFLLPDGRSVWVAEGVQEELVGVETLLEQKGMTMSTSKRTRPDYIATPDETRPTVRLVTLAAVLPVDSLNALVSKLKVQAKE